MMAVAMLAAACSPGIIDCAGPGLSVDVTSLSRFWRAGATYTVCADRKCSTVRFPTVDRAPDRIFVSGPEEVGRPGSISVVIASNGRRQFSAHTTNRGRFVPHSGDGGKCLAGVVLVRVDADGHFSGAD